MEDPIKIINAFLGVIYEEDSFKSASVVDNIVDTLPVLNRIDPGHVHFLLSKLQFSSIQPDFLIVIAHILKSLPNADEFEAFYNSMGASTAERGSKDAFDRVKSVRWYHLGGESTFQNYDEFLDQTEVAKVMKS